MRYALSALLAAFLLAFTINAKADISTTTLDSIQCGPKGTVNNLVEKTINRLPPTFRNLTSVRKLPRTLGSAFIAAYDALPPVGKTAADTVHLLANPRIPQQVYVIMSLSGCVVTAGALPTPMVQKMMLRAQRTSA